MKTQLSKINQATLVLAAPAQSNGVMVSPGKYIDLSCSAPSLEQTIRSSIDQAMRVAGFKNNSARCEQLILDVVMDVRNYRAHPHHSYLGKKVTRHSFGTARPKNRNQELLRLRILSVLWYCWMLGTDTKPCVNSRRNPDTRFVIFVKAIGMWFGLGNVVKNLERYQSYRKATLSGQSYTQWTARASHQTP